jgi:predicted ArsR family transcriptional regulator
MYEKLYKLGANCCLLYIYLSSKSGALSTRTISEELGIGRQAVRAALDKLIKNGLITQVATQFKTQVKIFQITDNHNVRRTKKTKATQETTQVVTQEKGSYGAFQTWLRNKAPYICTHYTHLISETEFDKLKSTYTAEQVSEVIEQIENRVDKRKQYTNLYLTSLNWLKNGKNIGDNKEERFRSYAAVAAKYASQLDNN